MKETRAQRRERNVKEAYRRGRIDQIHAEADFCDSCMNHWYEDMAQLKKEVREKAIDEYSNELFKSIERCNTHCKLDLGIDDLHNLEIIIKGLAEQMKGESNNE